MYHLMWMMRQINWLLISFGKVNPPKIKRSTIIGEKCHGGLKMVDFGIMESALKTSWIQRIHQKSGAKWKILPEYLLSHLGGCSFLLICHYDVYLLQVNKLPPFYLSVLKYWQDYRSLWSDNFTQIHNQIIWIDQQHNRGDEWSIKMFNCSQNFTFARFDRKI